MKHKHTEETRKILSEKRKQWLAANPDKHPWRSKNKFKSIPCEVLKEKLKLNNINFVEEFQPALEQNKFYSIDIAIPEKMIGIEVNGNQHYNKDGTLKSYYSERSKFIKQLGWQLVEVHYSLVYNDNFIQDIINAINNSQIVFSIDYTKYINTKKRFIRAAKKYFCVCGKQISQQVKTGLCRICFDKKRAIIKKPTKKVDINKRAVKSRVEKYNLCQCGDKKLTISLLCTKCRSVKRRKVERPSRECLAKELWEIPASILGSKYNVSDKTIAKWAKFYNLTKPGRGYWAKLISKPAPLAQVDRASDF